MSRQVLIIGASGGIGAALQRAYEARGDRVVGLSRGSSGLDVTDEPSIARAFAPLEGPFEQVICATGVLSGQASGPEKAIPAITPEALAAQFAVNATGPMLVLKHVLRFLPRDRPSVFAALSARVGSIGDNRLGGWYSYRASKAALNQLMHTAAIEIARSHKQAVICSLHPGTVATDFTQAYRGRHAAVPAEEAAQNLLRVMDGLTPEQSGGFYDWSGAEVPW